MNSSCISVSFPFKGQVHTNLKGLMSQLSTVKEAGLECLVQMSLLSQKESMAATPSTLLPFLNRRISSYQGLNGMGFLVLPMMP